MSENAGRMSPSTLESEAVESHDQKLDPHAKPPDELKTFYKRFQKLKSKDLGNDDDLIDLERPENYPGLKLVREIDYRNDRATSTPGPVKDDSGNLVPEFLDACEETVKVYEHEDMPGKLAHANTAFSSPFC